MKGILASRKFWALVIGSIVLFSGLLLPNFHLNEEAAVGLIVVIAAYILGVGVDPGPGGWKGVIASRKFWGAVIGLLVVVMDGFGLKFPAEFPPETVVFICVTIGAYIGGVAIEGVPQLKAKG